jgi:hypothetical protein
MTPETIFEWMAYRATLTELTALRLMLLESGIDIQIQFAEIIPDPVLPSQQSHSIEEIEH